MSNAAAVRQCCTRKVQSADNIIVPPVSGTCDTRESELFPMGTTQRSFHLKGYAAVLKRDGTDVTTNSACNAVSGNWFSPYDDVTTTDSSDFDIDHLVPLKEVSQPLAAFIATEG